MTVPLQQLSDSDWVRIILSTHPQTGGVLVGYSGLPFQRGYGFGSFIRSLFRMAAPVAKKAFKNIAKQGLTSAVGVGSDLLQGRDLKESLTEHGKSAGINLVDKGAQAIKRKIQKGGRRKRKNRRKTQKGKGIGFRSRKKIIIKRKRKQIGYAIKKKRTTKSKRKRILKIFWENFMRSDKI